MLIFVRAGSWFSHHQTKLSVKDHSILEALSASLDEKEDRQSGPRRSASEAKHFNEAQQFSAVYEGKARRIAQIIDTRIHQRMEQALVEWTDGTHGMDWHSRFERRAQDHVRARMQDELGVRGRRRRRTSQNPSSKNENGVANLFRKMHSEQGQTRNVSDAA